ncbi:g10415 [Coccomyxa viridis]|uniref:G10415 protein n=1 Tax=Coccomyxa viridis TaxID=1274662 RepID=A0ABP1G5M8_9CHLO
MEIKEAESDADVARCLAAMSELRTHFKEDSSNFVQRVQQQRERGYHLVYLEDQGSIQAVAGYRIRDSLERATPRDMYVADLVSMPTARSKGYGYHIFSFLEETAKKAGCARLLLESNIERERAHKFYVNQGLTKTAYRFAKDL